MDSSYFVLKLYKNKNYLSNPVYVEEWHVQSKTKKSTGGQLSMKAACKSAPVTGGEKKPQRYHQGTVTFHAIRQNM